MPKKFAAENTKAVAARERKRAAKDEAVARREKEIEDSKWRDDDKQILKKQQKKEAEERKRQEQLQRKAEAKALLEKEMSSLKSTRAPPSAKITRAQIQVRQDETIKKKQNDKKIETHLDAPLVENINRLQIDGEEARTVEEAIDILGDTVNAADKHPEKRLKAAYLAYEERKLKEEWQKSTENPLNKV
ncbi:hypothetical protein GWI33_019726 [Rhynchophorus ferrugineus]|uniref:Coiled-coil domain-containing protein n=1 Tax=Rhynchophorus ferrugineus TaxID=354439 RepID=A0A834HQW0_RHYFE|nr:hypothetical protein GWI33_019726 [Rhynchophorus ferrugineus]